MNLKVWVKYGNHQPTGITIANDADVDELIKEIKQALAPILDGFSVAQITLHLTEDSEGLRPGLTVKEVLNQHQVGRTDENPLIVKTVTLMKGASNESLDFSVSSKDSCKSRSTSGICATGRHVNRLKKPMSKFRKALLRRDGCCVATGENDLTNLTAAHIVPLNESQRIRRDQMYSPQNGILLRRDLEQSYDLFQWIFDANGVVTVLYEHWIHKNHIKRVNLSSDVETRPSVELIEIHNEIAKNRIPNCCPNCWKYVGRHNIDCHLKGSCETVGFLDDGNHQESDDEDD